MSTLRVTEIQSNSTSYNAAVRFETSGGVENGRLNKVWVHFNGQGTVSIRNHFNVNSISDNTTGDYTINFARGLASANYSAVGGSTLGSTGYTFVAVNAKYNAPYVQAPSSSNCRIVTTYSGAASLRQDPPYVSLMVSQ